MKRVLAIAAMAMALAAVTAPKAEAAYILTLTSGAVTQTVTGPDNPPTAFANYNGAVGSTWTINVSTGLAQGNNPTQDLNSVNVASTGGTFPSTLTIRWSVTNHTGPFPSFLDSIGGTLGTGFTLSYSAWANSNNVLDAKTCLIGSAVNFNTSPFSGGSSGACAVGALYSITQEVVITAANSGSISFDADVRAVPEPASMVLLGTGLLGIAVAARRIRK